MKTFDGFFKDGSALSSFGGEDEDNQRPKTEIMEKTKSIKLKKLCKAKNLELVDNKTLMQSMNTLKCMPGYQTVK
jgi:hypothetical protein